MLAKVYNNPPQVSLGCIAPHREIHLHSPQALRILTDGLACSEVYNFQPRGPDLVEFLAYDTTIVS